MRKSLNVLALPALALLLIIASLPGCGSGGALPATGGVASAPARLKVRMYKDRQLRFTVAFPQGWVVSKWHAPAGVPKTGDLVSTVAFANPKGTTINGRYVDAEHVSVSQLDRAVKPGAKYPDTSRRIMSNLLHKLTDAQPTGPPTEFTSNGDPGWRISYSYTLDGQQIFASSGLILKHQYAYWLTGQSAAGAWRTTWPVLRVAMGAFKVS